METKKNLIGLLWYAMYDSCMYINYKIIKPIWRKQCFQYGCYSILQSFFFLKYQKQKCASLSHLANHMKNAARYQLLWNEDHGFTM